MNKQEAIEKIEKRKSTLNGWEELTRNNALNEALDIVRKIDEPEKPVVPKFVAEWIEDHKGDYSKWDEESRADFIFRSINDLFRFEEGLSTWDFTIYEEFSKWTTENAYEFITAILSDYTVKKEKLYTVEIPNPNRVTEPIIYLSRGEEGKIFLNSWFVYASQNWKNQPHAQLTESEIKEDFEWAWPFAEEVEE